MAAANTKSRTPATTLADRPSLLGGVGGGATGNRRAPNTARTDTNAADPNTMSGVIGVRNTYTVA
jgi:hypothetical protein